MKKLIPTLLVLIFFSFVVNAISGHVFEQVVFIPNDNDTINTQPPDWTDVDGDATVAACTGFTNQTMNVTSDGTVTFNGFSETEMYDFVTNDGVYIRYLWGDTGLSGSTGIFRVPTIVGNSFEIGRFTPPSDISKFSIRGGDICGSTFNDTNVSIPIFPGISELIIEANITGVWASINGIEITNGTTGHNACDLNSGIAIFTQKVSPDFICIDEMFIGNMSVILAVGDPVPVVIIFSPIDDQFVADDIVNVTISSDIDTSRCDLFTNETGVFNSTSHILDQTGGINFTLQHDVPDNTTTDFIYFVGCNSTTNVNGNSSQITIHYDNQNPLTFFTIPNSENITEVFDSIKLQIDVMNTNLQNITWNITSPGNEEIYQNDTFGLILGTSYTIEDTIDLIQNTTGVYTVQVRACDVNLCSDTFATFNLTILDSGIIFVNYAVPTNTVNATTIIIVNSTNQTFVNWFCLNQTNNQTILLITNTGDDGILTLNTSIPNNCLFPSNVLQLSGNCTGTNSFCEFFEEKVTFTISTTSPTFSTAQIVLLSLIPLLLVIAAIVFVMKKTKR